MRRRHPLSDKQPAEHIRKEQLGQAYKLFMHIADFYAMWLSDKKQLWSIGQKHKSVQSQSGGVRDRLAEKEEDLRSGTKKQMTWENLYQKDSVRNRSHAAVHPLSPY